MAFGSDKEYVTDHRLRKSRSGKGGYLNSECKASQVDIMRNPCNNKSILKSKTPKLRCLQIATWNVKSMYESGKAHNIVKEVKRLKINIMGISETHWPNSGECNILDHAMYYSGNDTPKHNHGVGIIVAPRLKSSIKSYIALSDRMILLQLYASPFDLNIIQIYAPTADKEETIMEDFYEQLEILIKATKKNEITLIMGDFNAKVGQSKTGKVVGNFGLGERNERGDRLVQFCQEHNLVLTNTLFKLPHRRLYTWKSPADSPDKIIRNQIDYIAAPIRFRNSIKAVKTYPGADVASDHNPVVCKFEVKLKKPNAKNRPETLDIRKLSNNNIKQQMQENLNTEISKILKNNNEPLEKWSEIKEEIRTSSSKFLLPDKRKKKDWMTAEILDMMEERRIYKTKDTAKYRETHRRIRALFSLQVLIQRCRDMNKDVYICFIDYAKAFDNVKHEKIIEVLHKIGVDYKDIRTIASLYWGQTAKVKVGSTFTNKIEIKKGVRQGCILSPILFNIYSEEVFKTALEESTVGIKINGEIINNIRYADDTVILASSMEELSCLMSKIQKTSAQYGLRLNITKTKWMLVSKTQQPPQQLILDDERIEHVDSYIYLGTTVNSNWDQAKEIRIRVEKARASFTSMKQIFTSKSLTLPLKIRLLKCYVFPVLLYGMEAWTMTATLMKKVEAFEMWAYRRILRISWTEHVTNEEVLRRIGKERER
ncbi:uncharacterized protein [Diabrotica undecimpunctata]|uniref:uncharacterized protein n=1 Tax=Diabrotica undecimpunctata TaxID=50387 RepID=UPI003B635416